EVPVKLYITSVTVSAISRFDDLPRSPPRAERQSSVGWAGRIRTFECQVQSLVPYQLGDRPARALQTLRKSPPRALALGPSQPSKNTSPRPRPSAVSLGGRTKGKAAILLAGRLRTIFPSRPALLFSQSPAQPRPSADDSTARRPRNALRLLRIQ